MRLDAVLELMMDRAQVQIVLHGLEGGLDLDELDIEPPQLRRLPPGEIGAQQIAAFAPPHLAQLVAIEREAETGALGSDLNIDQTPCLAVLPSPCESQVHGPRFYAQTKSPKEGGSSLHTFPPHRPLKRFSFRRQNSKIRAPVGKVGLRRPLHPVLSREREVQGAHLHLRRAR